MVCLEDREILKIFIECIIWETKKVVTTMCERCMAFKICFRGAHLPISYRIQFNFLNTVASAPYNLSFFIFLVSLSASRYLVSRVSQYVPGYFCVDCCSLPPLLFLTMLPAPLSHLSSFHPIFSLLLPPLIPCPSQGVLAPYSWRDCYWHSQSGES